MTTSTYEQTKKRVVKVRHHEQGSTFTFQDGTTWLAPLTSEGKSTYPNASDELSAQGYIVVSDSLTDDEVELALATRKFITPRNFAQHLKQHPQEAQAWSTAKRMWKQALHTQMTTETDTSTERLHVLFEKLGQLELMWSNPESLRRNIQTMQRYAAELVYYRQEAEKLVEEMKTLLRFWPLWEQELEELKPKRKKRRDEIPQMSESF